MSTTEMLPSARNAPRLALPRALMSKLRAALPKPSLQGPRRVAGLDARLLADLGLRPVSGPSDSRQYAGSRKRYPTDRLAELDYAYYAALQRR